MRFKEIIGHQVIKDHLIRTVSENRVSHAQLFLGPAGNGALALAIAYAQFINCEQKHEDDSCGVCPSCRKYEKFIHPDLHFSYPFFSTGPESTSLTFIEEWRNCLLTNPYMDFQFWREQFDVENKQANIPIKEAHQIITKLSLKSFEAEYKVLILWLPEYLDKQGNALLKLIEEPPSKTLFLLVAENPDKILNTILSRTQLIKIPAYNLAETAMFLSAKTGMEIAETSELAILSQGSLAQALTLLHDRSDQYFDTLVQWLRLCVTDSGKALVEFSEKELASLGRENQKNFLQYGIHILRMAVFSQWKLDELAIIPPAAQAFIAKFSSLYSLEQLDAAIGELEKRIYHIERNANAKLLFLNLSLQLVLIFKYQTFRQEADSII